MLLPNRHLQEQNHWKLPLDDCFAFGHPLPLDQLAFFLTAFRGKMHRTLNPERLQGFLISKCLTLA